MPDTIGTIQHPGYSDAHHIAAPAAVPPATKHVVSDVQNTAAATMGPDPTDSVFMQDMHAPFTADSLAICHVSQSTQKQSHTHTAVPPQPPAWTKGLEPRPLPPGANSDIPALLGIGIVLAIISLRRGTRLLSSIGHDLRPGVRATRRYDERDAADRWSLAGIYTLLVICCTILLTKALEPSIATVSDLGTVPVLLLTLAVGAYFLFMLAGYNIVGYAFGDTHKRKAWLRAYNATQVPLALALTIPVTLAVFDPPAAGVALIIAAALCVLARIAFFIKGFSIFYINISSPFYFILYLCTLEITPVIFLYSCALKIVSVGA